MTWVDQVKTITKPKNSNPLPHGGYLEPWMCLPTFEIFAMIKNGIDYEKITWSEVLGE